MALWVKALAAKLVTHVQPPEPMWWKVRTESQVVP